jgi:hypothetical protein
MNTLLQQQQQKAQTLKEQVCRLLHWNDEAYAAFQFEMGLAYLQEYIPNDPHGAQQLTHSKVYWNWWKNSWLQRDEIFVREAKEDWDLADRLYIYSDSNNPSLLIGNTRPNAVVLEETYKEMIQEFIDDINQTA